MKCAILCYQREEVVEAWTPAHDAEVIGKLLDVQRGMAKSGRLGPVGRLAPTRTAKTLRKDVEPPRLVDGPFAETKEHLLGFYIVECDSIEQALDDARALARANPGGAYEVRPLRDYLPAGV